MSKRLRTGSGLPLLRPSFPEAEVLTFVASGSEPDGPVSGSVYNDDGTNTCDPIAENALRYYTGSAWQDMPSATCGSGSGSSSLVLTDGTNPFTMNSGTSFKWYQIGPLLFFKAYVQWSSKGSASGSITINSALPGVTVASPPAFQGGSIDSYTGIAIGNADDQPAFRVDAGADDFRFLITDPNNGTAMALMTDTSFAASGIMYLTGVFFMAGRNASV